MWPLKLEIKGISKMFQASRMWTRAISGWKRSCVNCLEFLLGKGCGPIQVYYTRNCLHTNWSSTSKVKPAPFCHSMCLSPTLSTMAGQQKLEQILISLGNPNTLANCNQRKSFFVASHFTLPSQLGHCDSASGRWEKDHPQYSTGSPMPQSWRVPGIAGSCARERQSEGVSFHPWLEGNKSSGSFHRGSATHWLIWEGLLELPHL